MRGFARVGGLAIALGMSACAAQAPNVPPGSPGQAIRQGSPQALAAGNLAAEAGLVAIRKVLQYQLNQGGQIRPGPGRPQVGPPPQQQGEESPFAELAKARPDLKPRIGQLEARMKRLNEAQQKALAGSMWDEVKDKTMAQMLERSRTWQKQPTDLLDNWDRMLSQVESMTPQALQAAASSLPPEMAQGGVPGGPGAPGG